MEKNGKKFQLNKCRGDVMPKIYNGKDVYTAAMERF